jgi:hypothetical protein
MSYAVEHPPSGTGKIRNELFDAPDISGYSLHEDRAPGIFTSRIDLAASMVEQVDDRRFVGKTVAVTTTAGSPTMWQMLRREALGRD